MDISADMKSRFRASAKVCSGVIMVLLVIAVFGPAKWAPRTELGWQFDHFIGYFGVTLFVCFGWPRPLVIGGVLAFFGALLEGLQAFTPDRTANLVAALCGAGGAVVAALVTEIFLRVWTVRGRRKSLTTTMPCPEFCKQSRAQKGVISLGEIDEFWKPD